MPDAAGVDAVSIPVTGPDARHRATGALARTGFTATVDLPNRGQMVVLEWDGSPTASVELRSRTGGTWSDWVEAHANPDEAPDDDRSDHSSVGPIWVGSGTDRVQVRVHAGRLANLAVDSLRADPVATARTAAAPAPAAGTPRAATQPRIRRRAEWGGGPYRCSGSPDSAKLKFAVVHHTVNTNSYGASQVDDMLRGIYYHHTQVNGWCDVAYNFVVDRFGGIWEGRTDSINRAVIGGHAKGFNTNSVGVSLLGQHHPGASPPAARVTAAQREATRRVIGWKFAVNRVDPGRVVTHTSLGSTKYPAGRVVRLNAVIGHRDVSLTACPGDYAYGLLSGLRRDARYDVMRSGPFDRLPNYTPARSGPAALVADRWGGIHPAGRAAPVRHTFFTRDWSSARGIAGGPGAGYVVDLSGGLHPYGLAPRIYAGGYWPGWDMVRSIGARSNLISGWVLDAYGGIHPYGGAPRIRPGMTWPGWRIARDVAVDRSGRGGFVLDGWGGIHRFGNVRGAATPHYWRGWDIARAIAMRPDGPGGYVLDAYGGLWPFGGAPRVQSPHYVRADVHRDLVLIGGGRGYIVDADGRTWPFGGAPALQHSLTWTGLNLTAGMVASR
jgi:hypothetical protein